MPAIVSGITVTTIALIGYTAIAGVIGAGGLGDLAYLMAFQEVVLMLHYLQQLLF